MQIDVLWEEMDWDTPGPRPAGTRVLETLTDDDSLVERFLGNLPGDGFPYLRGIGLDTATFFHQQHIPQLAAELEALSERNHEPEVAKHLRAVSQFVSGAIGPKDTLISFRARHVGTRH
jgi:hypothetical protein